MVSTRHHRPTGYWIFSMLVSLLCFLVPCTGAWSQGKRLQTDDTRQRSAGQGLYVAVQEGRLSVDLQEADMAEVLAQIGRQAGIRVSSGPSSGKKVSARFSGVELEEGLRRLLRSVSLSHIFMYASRPAGSVTISEVRVLGEGKEAPPPQPPSLSQACTAMSKIPALQAAGAGGKPQNSCNRFRSQRLNRYRGNQARSLAASGKCFN